MKGVPAARLLVLAAAVSAAPLQARSPLETFLGRTAVAEAVRLGSSNDQSAIERFHAPYRQLLGGPLLQSVELISEFRRVVLAAEQARGVGLPLDADSAERAIEPFRGLVTLLVRVRFDPKNTYRSMPRLEAFVYAPDGRAVAPVTARATPSHLSGPAPAGTPILEGRLEADFPASSLVPPGHCLVGVFLEGREVQRIPLDLDRLR